jgi:hypothetical protein
MRLRKKGNLAVYNANGELPYEILVKEWPESIANIKKDNQPKGKHPILKPNEVKAQVRISEEVSKVE